MRLAAVDIGTNTVRLLVADVIEGRITEVVRDRAITRLGAGVDASRRLDAAAIERTISAAASFVERATREGAERIRVAGTSALRDAADSEAFVIALRDVCGTDLEILTGPNEGRLSLLGATLGLPEAAYVVCDIGGGSTELATRSESVSLDIGSVRLKERLLRDDPPTDRQVSSATELVEAALDTAVVLGIAGYETFVGVAGTITTVAALILGLDAYDRDRVHGARLALHDVNVVTARLLKMTASEIVVMGPVEPGRADVIGGGALILRTVMRRFSFREVVVSETDILDGLVLDLAETLA